MAKVKDLDSQESRLIEGESPGNWDEILMVAAEIGAGEQAEKKRRESRQNGGGWGFPPCEEYDEPAHFPNEV